MGKRLSDDAESKNIQHLNSFRGYWSSSAEYPEENYGNNHVRMPVHVLYEWADGYSRIEFVSEFCAFVRSGPDDGMIDIDDISKVRIKDFGNYILDVESRESHMPEGQAGA